MSYAGDDAIKVLGTWLDHVNALDIEGVLALYSKEAVLLPTFSGEMRTTREKIRNYFESLSGYDNVRVMVNHAEVVCQSLGGSVFALSGPYRWSWEKDGNPEEIEARFTYIIDVAAEAPISHHHSSLVPGAS